MARDLGGVLHYFLPELEPPPETRTRPRRVPLGPTDEPRPVAGTAARILVPLGDRDVVRAALVWNLAVELGRLRGERCAIRSAVDERSPLWPDDEAHGPAVERVDDLGDALDRHGFGPTPSVSFHCAPAGAVEAALRRGVSRVWLLVRPEREALREAARAARRFALAAPGARLGVTLHGVRRIAEAEQAFERLAEAVEVHLEHGPDGGLRSYGLLVDDLALYRAIVDRHPVSLSHPQSPATRALRDVARLLHEDAP